MEELQERRERMVKLSKRLKTAREYKGNSYYKNSQSLKSLKTKKTYTSTEGDSKLIRKFYPQSTTNKENKQIDFTTHFQDSHSIEDSKANLSINKYGLKSYNYQALNTIKDSRTPSNKSSQNFSIKYQFGKNSQVISNAKRVSDYSTKAKSMQREESKMKKNTKSINSITNKSLSMNKSKQKLSREKIRFKPESKVGVNFQSKPYIGKMIPPKTQREMQSFFNGSAEGIGDDEYSGNIRLTIANLFIWYLVV